MAEKKRLVVEYSPRSLNNAIEIASYLRRKFTEKEVNRFYQFLYDFEQIIGLYPLYMLNHQEKISEELY